jgi:hypothetical protein
MDFIAMICCTIGIIIFLSGLGLILNENTQSLGLIVIAIGIAIILYAVSRSRGSKGNGSNSRSGSGSDDFRDMMVPPIGYNFDYCPPSPSCESGSPNT